MRRVNKEGKELKIVCIFILLSIYKNVKIFTISYITTFNAENCIGIYVKEKIQIEYSGKLHFLNLNNKRN